jgi:hypothetical protein
VTTATRLSVIFEKSMYALRMFDLIGFVTSRMSMIFMTDAVQRGSDAPPQMAMSWPVIAAAAGESR